MEFIDAQKIEEVLVVFFGRLHCPGSMAAPALGFQSQTLMKVVLPECPLPCDEYDRRALLRKYAFSDSEMVTASWLHSLRGRREVKL